MTLRCVLSKHLSSAHWSVYSPTSPEIETCPFHVLHTSLLFFEVLLLASSMICYWVRISQTSSVSVVSLYGATVFLILIFRANLRLRTTPLFGQTHWVMCKIAIALSRLSSHIRILVHYCLIHFPAAYKVWALLASSSQMIIRPSGTLHVYPFVVNRIVVIFTNAKCVARRS